MTIEQIPALGVGLIMAAYWGRVAVMVVRVGRRTRRLQHMVVAVNPVERLMMLVWAPLIWVWITLPIVAAIPALSPFFDLALPGFLYGNTPLTITRFAALGVAAIALLLSILCWMHMGNDWRMAIDPSYESRLIQDGPFAIARHPIYSLSILLMICTVIILPTISILVIAVAHIALMIAKVRSEEAFLSKRYGAAYAEYSSRTGRLLPYQLIPFRNAPPSTSIAGGANQGAGASDTLPPIFKLNHFQRAMVRWEHLHAYNAVHAVRLRGPANTATLRDAIEAVRRESGLGKLIINEFRKRCAFAPSSDPAQLLELPPSKDPQHTLHQVLEEGLNTRFPDGPHDPIRWIVFDEAAGDFHRIVLVYHHVAADAAGVEALLGRVVRKYVNSADDDPGPLRLGPPEDLNAQQRPFVRYGFFRSYFRTMGVILRVWGCRRARPETPGDERTGMVSCRAPDGLLEGIQNACRRKDIGVNDAFLAAVAVTVGNQVPPRPSRPGGQRIALGSIVSRRPKTNEHSADYFGVSLSDLIVTVDRPLDPISNIAIAIHAQTKACKADLDGVDAISDMRLLLAWLAWPWIRNSRKSYRRSFPLSAGVSMASIKPWRFGDAAKQIDEYIRASPTGPVMPVVLAPTIFDKVLCLGVFHRRAFMETREAEAFLKDVVARLHEFAGL